MNIRGEQMRLYAVTDRTWAHDAAGLLEQVAAAVDGGAGVVQLREKHLEDAAFLAEAERFVALCRQKGAVSIINDNVEIAVRTGADGVHVGQDDLEAGRARTLLGPDKIVGATAKTVPQALEAFGQGADYLGVGAIYPTTTKVVTVITSTETLGEICRAVPIPVNAIGGLNRENLGVLRGIPIRGICVVSAIMKSADPKATAEGLRQAFEALKN